MSRSDRRFARVYYDDLRRDYPEVWDDDGALAAWLRLLVVAENAWPTKPELPRSVKARALKVLTDVGLVALGPRHTFAVKGHDAERSRRHAIAVAAAAAKGAPNGRPSGAASADPRRERDENETNTPPPQVGKRENGTNPRALGTNPRAIGTSPRQEREAQKRGAMPENVASILARAAKAGR